VGSDRTFGQLVADYLVSAVEADGTFVRITDPDILVNTSTRTRVEARFGATQLLTAFRDAARPAMRDGTILVALDQVTLRPRPLTSWIITNRVAAPCLMICHLRPLAT
jgi:hypothetical protein